MRKVLPKLNFLLNFIFCDFKFCDLTLYFQKTQWAKNSN